MGDQPTAGSRTFVWHDLTTKDVDAAVAFYGELFGWETEDHAAGGGPYKMIRSEGKEQGGIMASKPGMPSCWMGYVCVGDVDAVAARAEQAGGKVYMPPTNMPNVGRMAVIADPTGGVLSPIQLADAAEPRTEGQPPAGRFCWDELLARDVAAAKDFYTGVIGWTTEEVDMGPMGTYTLFKHSDVQCAGMLAKPQDAPGASAWLSYVAVDDIEADAARTSELGGKIWVKPTAIPNMGRFSVCEDPSGAMFALFTSQAG
jgi:predicted enzyme related to lactoylglutathione lyase